MKQGNETVKKSTNKQKQAKKCKKALNTELIV